MRETMIGRHRYWREGDVLGLHFDGQVAASDLATLREVMGSVFAEPGRHFMIADMTLCTGIDAPARRYLGEWSKQQSGNNMICVAYGINFATRAIVTLALNAIKLLGKQEIDLTFVKTEAEARTWVDEQRSTRFPEASP